MITEEQLRACVPEASTQAIEDYTHAIAAAMEEFEINTVARAAGFIAQCAHESGNFKYVKENLNYSAQGLTKTFPKYFNASNAEAYGRKPEAIANRVYANRMGNGDEKSGDGWKFRGRGILQLTGKSNYQACSKYLFEDNTLLDNPDILLDPYYATHSACWFWNTNKLNQYADNGDFVTMTKKINGGTIGLDDRIKHYNHALKVLTGSH